MIVNYWGEKWAKKDFIKDSSKDCSVQLSQVETRVIFPLGTTASGGWQSKGSGSSHCIYMENPPQLLADLDVLFFLKNKQHMDLVCCNLVHV